MSKKIKQCFIRRGQVAVFYALLVPMILLVGGAGVDLGWYYLNVSRMQNAADAAVMAGAWEFLGDENTLSDYSNAMLIDFVPGYILEDPDTGQPVRSKRSTAIGDAKAKEFVKKNLARNGEWNNNEIVDGYGKDNDLTFTSNLYGSGQEDDGYYTMWYQVVLEEDVKHLFMPGWFEPMTARVQSTAKLTHYTKGDNLLNMTTVIAERETYESWDFIRYKKGDTSNTPADNRSVLSTGNKYREGDHHRFEVLRLDGYGGKNNPEKGNPYTSRGKVDQRGYDDLFVDWQPDMAAMTTEDLDIGVTDSKGKIAKAGNNSYTHFFTEDGTEVKLTGDTNLIRRTHGIINFEPLNGNFPYQVRDVDYLKNNDQAYKDMVKKYRETEPNAFKDEKGKDLSQTHKDEIIEQIAREPPDPLYVRIESEPVHDGSGFEKNADGSVKFDDNGNPIRAKGNNASSVHQIIINLNVANTSKYTSGKYAGAYRDRPVFFYYTGPEKVDPNSHVRDSLPVIINFNENFRGIFFFPNSPVVINGNQNNLEGYVIAKEFVMLKKYHYEGYEYRDDGNYGDYLQYLAEDEKTDIYYERSLLVEGTKLVSLSDDFAQITINGQTKYVLKSDLITDASDLVTIGDTTYRKDEVGTAEGLAYASGNGKIKYYYTLSKQENEGWIEQGTVWLDRNKAMTTDINGNPTTDKTKTVLAEFQSGWNYNNSGEAKGKGVWRVEELLPDGTEDGWLDEKEGYINRFLLKEEGEPASKPPKCVYNTADELLTAMGGYTKINDTQWKKNDAREYTTHTSGGTTYYLPKRVTLFDANDLVPESMEGKVPVTYYDENGNEKAGCADISGEDLKKYYKIYQDGIQGEATELNPMFIDELGNVQYRHKKDSSGNEIATNEDGSVAYETIEPTVDPHDDPALMRQAATEAVKKLTSELNLNANEDFANELAEELNLTEEDFSDEVATSLGLTPEDFSDAEKKLDYIAKKYPDQYKAAREKYIKDHHEDQYNEEVEKFFNEKFKALYEEDEYRDTAIKFFDCTKFGLASSVFDNFQLVWMTEYSYLNKQGENRSINNLFVTEDARRSD